MKRFLHLLSALIMVQCAVAQYTDLGVAVFDLRDYQGQHFFIEEDWTAELGQVPFGIESIRIPKGWEVWLYEGSDFTGNHRAITGSWDGNGSKDWQWRNDIRSIRIVNTYQPNPILQASRSTQGIAIFNRTSYRGEHRFIREDMTSDEGCFSFGIESIRIPNGWEVWIYEGDHFTGRHRKLTGDWDGEGSEDWKWRDDIRSIRIVRSTIGWKPKQQAKAYVTIYEHAELNGESFELAGAWSVTSSADRWNDRISSIEIPEGMEVHLFEHAHYRGRVKILKRDWRAKEPDHFWNDRISSIKVITRDYVMY